MAGEALDLLTRIAKETSLRYAMHMIMTAALCCKQRKSSQVEVADVRRVYGLFSDLRRSTQYLIEFNNQFMFNEIGESAEEEEAKPEQKAAGGAMEVA
jgi:RuvB-like protein 2